MDSDDQVKLNFMCGSFIYIVHTFNVISGLFNAFDENRDNHIDFKEMACGISACCRGPMTERQKCA